MKSNEEQLRKRGYIEEKDLNSYMHFTKEQLLELLQSKVASERTIAVRLLEEYQEIEVVKVLISRLIIEKKLYTKIALSETIGNYGEEASKILIKHLGKVGDNQHRSLPSKPFKKKNYPLPRDIIARTLCNIGMPSIKALRSCLYQGEYIQILEAIDAIGFISYYEGDTTSLDDIIELFNKYQDDDLLIWKSLRALQAFKGEKVLDILRTYSTSSVKQLKWEASRSIEQINRR
ncbi:MAG: HEAT repeat domain-containing protein [bacterium]